MATNQLSYGIHFLKGTWSMPRRNPNFTGRDKELEELHSRLSTQHSRRQRVNVVEVAGMGGVGKTQLVRVMKFLGFVWCLSHEDVAINRSPNIVIAIFQVNTDCESL